jgi:uncharacterized membrane protein
METVQNLMCAPVLKVILMRMETQRAKFVFQYAKMVVSMGTVQSQISVNVLKDMRKKITQLITTNVFLCALATVSMACAQSHTHALAWMDISNVNLIKVYAILFVLMGARMEIV